MRVQRSSLNQLAPSADPLPEWPEQVIGGKYVRLLQSHLDQLCQESRSASEHGKRQLFLDDVFVVHLLAFFNPTDRALWVGWHALTLLGGRAWRTLPA